MPCSMMTVFFRTRMCMEAAEAVRPEVVARCSAPWESLETSPTFLNRVHATHLLNPVRDEKRFRPPRP